MLLKTKTSVKMKLVKCKTKNFSRREMDNLFINNNRIFVATADIKYFSMNSI